MFIPRNNFTDTAIRKGVKNQKISPAQAAARLRTLQAQFVRVGDQVRAERCRDLVEKAEAAEFTIAFCGHFSAGKSTMINELMGADLLPTNPVPTSANVVKVKTGPASAAVTFKERGKVVFPYPYDSKEIQAYCTKGDLVDRVEITHPNDQLPEGVAILDTPGIDSTEDAHRVAAESMLHTADLVLYMTDYNHVQARLNGEFIAMLQEKMKPTWLLVNQIDKHIAFEVDFFAFADRIAAAFAGRGIASADLFFTTIREPGHPHNDLPRLKARLARALSEAPRRVVETVLTEAYLLVRDHLAWREAVRQKEIDQHHAVLGACSLDDEEKLRREWSGIVAQEQALTGEVERFEEEFSAQFDRLFANANLMPYHTRELARSFVESQQISFRVGRLFTRQRTKEERERRLARFHKEINENAAAYIDIHLKKLLLDHLERYHIKEERLRRSVYEMSVPLTRELLLGVINRGALFSTEYMIRFGSFVIEAIRRQYAEAAKERIVEAVRYLKEHRQQKAAALAAKRAKLEAQLRAWQALASIREGQQRACDELLAVLREGNEETAISPQELVQQEVRAFQAAEPVVGTRQTAPRVHIGRVQEKRHPRRMKEPLDTRLQTHHAVEALYASAQALQPLAMFSRVAEEMQKRARRMEERKYTIALFGAFSAGKSSFANALLGDNVLPVSPHPTTAAINHVLPPTAERPHGTVLVEYKQEAQLLNDMNQALEIAEQRVESAEELGMLLAAHEQHVRQAEEARLLELERIRRAEAGELAADETDEEAERTEKIPPDPLALLRAEQLSFLEAVHRGWPHMCRRLGTEQAVPLAELPPFVAVEEQACFVERVLLYYDSPLARQGVILIDTPGAGSMNARHTDVAFTHIKHADAVVFVTYYNHAFSRADREFLIQLGRVKDYFSRDKMFFIVNASDLAASEEEISEVLAHVERNLLACGIRNARLYPVSSQIGMLAARHANRALAEEEAALYRKLTGTAPEASLPEPAAGRFFSGLSLFEEDFRSFVTDELAAAAAGAAYEEIGRVLRQLASWRNEAQAEEKERAETERQTRAAYREAKAIPEALDTDIERGLIAQEVEELTYYVKQRVFYRYFDEYKAIFNVPAFSDETESMETLLRRYTNEVIRFVAFDLAQEMRATSLRMETFLTRTLTGIQRRIEQEIARHDAGVVLTPYRPSPFASPSFSPGLHEWNATKCADMLAPYTNRVTFFTEEGNVRLRDALEARLREPVSAYVTACEQQLKEAYLPMFDREVARLLTESERQMCEYFEGKLSVLSGTEDAGMLDQAYDTVRRCYEKHAQERREERG
ncbi:dynamin family protein [Aneurinibacillus sp. BA2021]|nr:dynamin family protein [Aneurinibacillus sp. BA2021]